MKRINFFDVCQKLSLLLESNDNEFESIKLRAEQSNPFFTQKEINRMLSAIRLNYLDSNKLKEWIKIIQVSEYNAVKTVGVIAAGNIPLVSFHDVLCILATGHHIKIKLSSKDAILSQYIYEKINEYFESPYPVISFVSILNDADAIIATGGELATNSFRVYFSKFPSLIRTHRNSVAILSGNENESELISLGEDIFSYYGLGCRNVSHLYLPEFYPVEKLISLFDLNFHYIKENNKYCNNYDYQLAISGLGTRRFLQGNTLLWIESDKLNAALATIHISYYRHIEDLTSQILHSLQNIQCICCNILIPGFDTIRIGQSQFPELTSYHDNINTLEFLNLLNK